MPIRVSETKTDSRFRDDILERPRIPAAAKDAKPMNRLLVLTTLGAADGTILSLAAAGHLSSVKAAILVGLTVVSGVGAWLAAQQAAGGDWRALLGVAAISTAATVAAAWVGVSLGAAVSLHILPKVAGVVLMLVAAEIAGLRLPRLGRVPLPVLAIGFGIVLEVLA